MFGGFRRFWRVWYLCKPIESYAAALALGGLGPGVPVWEVALALGCLLGTVFGGFGRVGGGFGGWSDRTSSTPAVVPGAAPALAKAGVGGYIYIYI